VKILHVLTASHTHAQLLLRCAVQAGFRESGAVSLTSATTNEQATPIVAVRSMGLSLESLIGYEEDGRRHLMVSLDYLETLVHISNERFTENTKRIDRFRTAFRDAMQGGQPKKNPSGGEWEDAAARRERLRAEGLKKREALKSEASSQKGLPVTTNDDAEEAGHDLAMFNDP
jgi:tRNA wybutosine-synthesizing protein 3